MATEKRYYYVSLAEKCHTVMKCAGLCPSEEHREIYEPHFRCFGVEAGVKNAPFRVLLLPYQGDLINTPLSPCQDRG